MNILDLKNLPGETLVRKKLIPTPVVVNIPIEIEEPIPRGSYRRSGLPRRPYAPRKPGPRRKFTTEEERREERLRYGRAYSRLHRESQTARVKKRRANMTEEERAAYNRRQRERYANDPDLRERTKKTKAKYRAKKRNTFE